MGFLKFGFVAILLVAVSARPDVERHANVTIIGGHNVPIETVPYMVSLRLNGRSHWCGGSIIHEWFILTAAHCIKKNRELKVRVGTDHIDGDGQLYDIEKTYIHERYNNKTHDYDVCLIKLKKPLTFGPKVGKVYLAPRTTKLNKMTILKVTGWGSNGVMSVSPNLLQTRIPLVGKRICRNKYAKMRQVITSRMICAGYRGHDSCQGDSGGPLTLGNVQVGVTSFGLGCGVYPGIYTRVASVESWINRKINIRY